MVLSNLKTQEQQGFKSSAFSKIIRIKGDEKDES